MRFRPLAAFLAGTVLGVQAELGATADTSKSIDSPASPDSSDNDRRCPHDNLLRCLIGTPTLAYTFCSWSVGIYPTPVTVYSTATISPTETEPPSETSLLTSIPTSQTSDHDALCDSEPTLSTVTITETTTATLVQAVTSTVTITRDHTQTATATVVQAVTGTTLTTSLTASTPTTSVSLSSPAPELATPVHSKFLRAARTAPKTSLACLDDLHIQPTAAGAVTSACACFADSQATPTVTATVTWTVGAPTCAGRQPTFPDCFADFHPYNCGTDHAGQVACSCALTTEGTAQCTLGDYERDNACMTSDDCAEGWYCTTIDCFGDGVPSVCTKGCPVVFAPGGGDGDGDDGDVVAAVKGTASSTASPRPHHALSRNLSILIVNNDGHGLGSGRSRTFKNSPPRP